MWHRAFYSVRLEHLSLGFTHSVADSLHSNMPLSEVIVTQNYLLRPAGSCLIITQRQFEIILKITTLQPAKENSVRDHTDSEESIYLKCLPLKTCTLFLTRDPKAGSFLQMNLIWLVCAGKMSGLWLDKGTLIAGVLCEPTTATSQSLQCDWLPFVQYTCCCEELHLK